MASTWIEKRSVADGVRYRVRFRLGGAESIPKYAGSFATKREALLRKAWVSGEIAAMRVPDVKALVEPEPSPTLREVAERWRTSRKDVRTSTAIQHQTALNRVYSVLGAQPYDEIAVADVQRMVDVLAADGKARESIRKSKTALAMVLDHVGASPNAARDRRVKLPLEEPEEVEPPVAAHVEAVAWLLPAHYLIGLLVLDATGARIGEIEAARIGDLDESRRAWLVRAKIAKTRRARWVELPSDLYSVLVDRLPAREDRDPAAPLFPIGSADNLRMAVGRACRDAGVPTFSPHDLRHRRISLLHHDGETWAEIGARVGQRNLSVTADRYTHAMLDYGEIDRPKLLGRVRVTHTPMHTPHAGNTPFAGAS